jgi:hypothetical protein
VAALSGIFMATWILSATVLWYHLANTRPRIPHPDTGNIYVLNTHGSYAYLTLGDCVRLYGAMAFGLGGNLTIYIVYVWRRALTS